MKSEEIKENYVAFLRGINVSGHHKVPMAVLRKELEKIGFENVITILNSGNVLFQTKQKKLEHIEEEITAHLENHFGFPIPTIVRKLSAITQLFNQNPFKDVIITKDIRLYISFLKTDTNTQLELPSASADNSYKIIDCSNKSVLSILDLSLTGTPKAMDALEKFYGKNITTRNWKTIERIKNKASTEF